MSATLTDYFDELKTLDEFIAAPEARQSKPPSRTIKHPPETDIAFWLRGNAPLTFLELGDLRYCLYHRCSRADYTVTKTDKDDFDLRGRNSSLHIVSNKARRFLLWKLRILAREKEWVRCRTNQDRH